MNNIKEFKSEEKYLLTSPRKLRLVVAVIKKMKPAEAVEKLPFVHKRAAGEISKVIKNAIASARAQGVSETDLSFSEIQINEGPRLKRGRAASRGMWHPFKRRMSHIRVILKAAAPKKEVAKEKVEEPKQVEQKVKKGAKNGTKS